VLGRPWGGWRYHRSRANWPGVPGNAALESALNADEVLQAQMSGDIPEGYSTQPSIGFDEETDIPGPSDPDGDPSVAWPSPSPRLNLGPPVVRECADLGVQPPPA
jgi:hypothetical protein